MNPFTTIAVFPYSAEAQIVKGKLESEGIEVFLVDEYTIDTDPLVSQAIGGVKLRVRTEDCEAAEQILKATSKYSKDDQGNALICPQCGSHRIHLLSNVYNIKSLLAFLLGLLLVLLPFYTRYSYTCMDCKKRFG